MPARPELEGAYRTTALVCGAVVAATVVYAVVVEVIRASFEPFEGFAPSPGLAFLRYGLYGLGFGHGLVIEVMRRHVLASLPRDPTAALGRLRTSAIATAALAEAAAVYGLVLFLLAGAASDFYLLVAWSLALQLVYFPRRERWAERLRGLGQ